MTVQAERPPARDLEPGVDGYPTALLGEVQEPSVQDRLDEPAEDRDTIGQYLEEISRYPLLTAEQEVEYSKQIEAGTTAEILLALRDPYLREGARNDLVTALELKNKKMRRKQRPTSWDESVSTPELREENVNQWQEWADGLDTQEVEELGILQAQGAAAKRSFIESNLRLTVSIAKRYRGKGMSFLDLIQEGNEGLMHAVDKFDFAQGYKFSTYGTWWIRQSITRALANQVRPIRLPVHVVERIDIMVRTRRDLTNKLGRDPSDSELAEALGVTAETLAYMRTSDKRMTSLNDTVGARGSTTEQQEVERDPNEIPVHELAMHGLRAAAIQDALSVLNERERIVISSRYGLEDGKDHTLVEIGRMLGVTRERVRQMEKKALDKLAASSHADKLEGFVI